MKNVVFCVLVFLTSCSGALVLQNRVFISDESIYIYTLDFVNDSICVYRQECKHGVSPSQYLKIDITCHYEICDRMIILNKLSGVRDSFDYEYISDTKSVFDSFFSELPDRDSVCELALFNAYAFINDIDSDTLHYYATKRIAYGKMFQDDSHRQFFYVRTFSEDGKSWPLYTAFAFTKAFVQYRILRIQYRHKTN